jgi:lipopolysaccharide exporter
MGESPPSLGRKIAVGSVWTVTMRFAIRGVGFISLLILARLLVPADFGIVAKAVMLYSILDILTQFGLEAALIRDQKATSSHYNTVWTLHVLRGAVIATILLVLAYPAAVFLREPALSTIIPFYALASVLRGFANVGTVDFRKQLNFDRDFIFVILKKLSAFTTTISIALIWKTYWALVAGVVAGALVELISSFKLSPYRPRFSLSEWRSLFNFSKWIFAHEIAGALSTKLDIFILSRFSSTAIVGTYTVASEIGRTPTTEFAMPIARALMPGLSTISDNKPEFQTLYANVLSLLLLITVPAALGLRFLSGPLTDLILGDAWTEMAPLLALLALLGITRTVPSLSIASFVAFGRVDVLSRLSLLDLALRAALLPIGFFSGGVQGMVLALLATEALRSILSLIAQIHLGMITVPALVSGTWRSIVSASFMYFALSSFDLPHYFGLSPSSFTALTIQVASGILFYSVCLLGLWQFNGRPFGPEQLILQMLRRSRRTPPLTT